MRKAVLNRETLETRLAIAIDIDGHGDHTIETPVVFFNHMLAAFARHGLFDLSLKSNRDLNLDQHHLIEDCGIALGMAFAKALADKTQINRSGFFITPMDEALAVVAVDLGGRPYLQFDVSLKRRFCGDFDTDLLQDFFIGFSVNLEANLAVRVPFGRSDHHKIEAIFKALGKSMKMACSTEPRLKGKLLSTKGVIKHDRYR